MDKSASCKIFEEYVDSLFPIGGKRSRSAVIRQDFAKRIVDHLKGKQIQMPHLVGTLTNRVSGSVNR